jgi:hypothetical protein
MHADDAVPRVFDQELRAAGGSAMSEEILFYASSNGDCWYLARDADHQKMLVRHQPNRASGGRSTFIDIDAFLTEGPSPQQEALRRVLGEK